MKTLIKDARILTMDDQFTEFDRADILIDGTKIEALGPDLAVNLDEPNLQVIDATNKLHGAITAEAKKSCRL